MEKKLFFRRTIVIGCILISTYYVVWGPHGLARYATTNQRLTCEQDKINRLQKDIALLKNSVARSTDSSFEIEKVARYDLSLGYTNEVICVLPRKSLS